MIRNVVFDLGRVLIRYEPDQIMRSLGCDEEMISQLMQHVFTHELWAEFDRGTYSMADMYSAIEKQHPTLSKALEMIFHPSFFEHMPLMKETEAFLRQLKDQGYRIYFLSNFSPEGFAQVENRLDFLQLGDGRVISGQVGYNKPEREIYELLLNNYDLIPEETLFIDDNADNIRGARALGIHGILFQDIEQVKSEFQKIKTL